MHRTYRRWPVSLVLTLCAAGWGAPSDPPGQRGGDYSKAVWSATPGADAVSSPVVFGGKVYVTIEPAGIAALQAETGEVLWTRTVRVTPPEGIDPTSWNARAEELQTEIQALREKLGKARRASRAGKEPKFDVEATRAKLDALRAEQEGYAPYLMPERGDGLGYANPTPYADATGVYAHFGNGMVGAWSHDGEAKWSRWLGKAEPPQRGYRGTDTASPLKVGEVLAVAHGSLHGLDAATGATLWTGPAYTDYGTPGVFTQDGKHWLITPDGKAVDVADGSVDGTGLGDLFYHGPLITKNRAYWVGRADVEHQAPVLASAVRLRWDGEKIASKQLFNVELPVSDRSYSTPVEVDGKLFVVTVRRSLVVLDASSGEVLHERKITEIQGDVWAGLTVVDGRIYIPSREGMLTAIETTSPYKVHKVWKIPTGEATPAFVDGAVIVRGEEGVQRRSSGS